MSDPNKLEDYILGRAKGQSRGATGKFTEIILVIFIALLTRFAMILTEVKIISIPVIDPFLKYLYSFVEKYFQDYYYQ